MSRTRRQSWMVEWADFWLKWGRDSTKRLTSRRFLERDGCGKPPGYEFWSRRPMNGSSGRGAKTICHRLERRRGKAALRKEVENVE